MAEAPKLYGVSFNQLSEVENELLTTGFDMEEIREAVWDCEGDKSPGPDGFNFKFIKTFWHLFQSDFKRVLDDFHSLGTWPKGSNASFIALIAKVYVPLGLNDFRPISLVGCIYKVVSKILSKRLHVVLSKIIDANQFTFLGERNMLDSVLVVNEVISEAKYKKRLTMVFKVDFEKAYESVRWDFLLYMLRRMNFSDKWIYWIRGCLESNSVSVLVNGSPCCEFKMRKGLR